jgi:magnesium-transporting ATPase (P-type)
MSRLYRPFKTSDENRWRISTSHSIRRDLTHSPYYPLKTFASGEQENDNLRRTSLPQAHTKISMSEDDEVPEDLSSISLTPGTQLLEDHAKITSDSVYLSDRSTSATRWNLKSWFRSCFGRGKEDTPRTLALPMEEKEQGKQRFPPNVVRNQKYHVLSFLFVVLYEQFKFFFNLYFLLVSLSQIIPALQIGYTFTYIAPLTFVLSITIGKEAWDDYIRYKRDKEANAQLYRKLTPLGLQNIPSAKIRVGDIIIVERNQRVPADMILLRTTEKSGSCFIRTDQLDGETDWKLR